jgi:hypothetical protein
MKDLVTCILAFGIAGVTLYMVVATFVGASGSADTFKNEKDVLLYGLSLLGAIIGYYFGRVPAELHAQQATAQANKAQDQLQQTQTQVVQTAQSAAKAVADKQQQAQDFKATLIAVKQNLQQAASPPVTTMKAAPQNTGLNQALAEIDAALKSL